MRFLRGLLDRAGTKFEKGQKLEKLYPLYEATDTFLFTTDDVTKGPAHIRDGVDLKRVMIVVVWALLPCIFMAMYNTGLQANQAMAAFDVESQDGWRGAVINALGLGYDPGNLLACLIHGALFFLPVYIVTIVAGGLWEVLFAIVRRHEVNEGFLVTSMLFPLTLPPTIPLWQVAIGISFGVVIGKEVFGGTGKNFLNPALTARALLYFAYPAQITGDRIWTAVPSAVPEGVDGFSGATILGRAASDGIASVTEHYSLMESFLGTIPGSMGETSVLACLIGAAFLIMTGIGSWRIMLSVLVGAAGFAWFLNGVGGTAPMFEMGPIWHLVSGGLMFGAVFMATDPVSAAMSNAGRWVYGLLIGVMTTLIRVINPAFPEGIMLAILFGNVFAPLIDYFVLKANIKRRMVRSVQ